MVFRERPIHSEFKNNSQEIKTCVKFGPTDYCNDKIHLIIPGDAKT